MPLISSEDPSFTSILEATSNLQPSSCCTRPADRSAAHRETIDMIKQYTKLPENIVDDLASIIDNPENGMILDVIMHDPFDSYMWCLLPTDVLHKYTVHWFRHVPAGLGNFREVQFEDHSQTGIQLPDPTFIALHAAVAHVSHFNPLSG
ncbi:hypothetical protein P692DRAFT_20869756 [Suillus brevipes Sb2]|nr:hypothetical protein P692DRAFT_20869756 [Suillus brevipes Sb2]